MGALFSSRTTYSPCYLYDFSANLFVSWRGSSSELFIPRHEVRLVIMLPSWVGRSNWVDGRSYWVEGRSYWVASSQIGSPDGRIGLFPDY